MKANYWVENEHRYIPYELPEGATMFETDMFKFITCACCGKKVMFGTAYTSRKIHDKFGLGYAVCQECYYNGEKIK